MASFVLQPRDLAVLRTLFECRILTARNIADIHFEGREEAAKKRLHKLKSAGLLSERRRRAFEPAVLFLGSKGFKLLQTEGVLLEYPAFDISSLEKRARVSEMTIRHELEVMDVVSALYRAFRGKAGWGIAECTTWPLLSEFSVSRFGNREILVRPDGFLRIHESLSDGGIVEHTFFLEVDRSTEVLDTLANRAACYLEYYKSGGFSVRNGATRDQFKDYSFRVLMVFKTAERRNNLAERLLQLNPPIFTQSMLSTLSEVKTNPLGSIWIRPREYQEATRGTAFDCELERVTWGYKRQSERELLVESKVERIQLF